jgi:hypothetical protein
MAVFHEMGVAGGTTSAGTSTTYEKIRSVVVDEIRKGNNPLDNDNNNDRMLGVGKKLRKRAMKTIPGDWFDIG